MRGSFCEVGGGQSHVFELDCEEAARYEQRSYKNTKELGSCRVGLIALFHCHVSVLE